MNLRHYVHLALVLLCVSMTRIGAAQSCSAGDGTPVKISFVNNTFALLDIFWVNYDCAEESYGQVAFGQTAVMNTYQGHEWVLRDAAGLEVERGIATTDSATILTVGDASALTNMTTFTYAADPEFHLFTDVNALVPCEVTSVPDHLPFELDAFYEQYCDFFGVPIISSGEVAPEALQEAWRLMAMMTYGDTRLLEAFTEGELRIGIVAPDEGITRLPEYAFLRDDPNMDWDARSRGYGATLVVPLGSGAEENLLCYDVDRYVGESIFIHEFAHTIMDMGLAVIDPAFRIVLNAAYEAAIEEGLWADTYAISTLEEYWAEGVQDYFNTNIEAIPGNGIHNAINTRKELAQYDPRLYAIIRQVFGEFGGAYTCP